MKTKVIKIIAVAIAIIAVISIIILIINANTYSNQATNSDINISLRKSNENVYVTVTANNDLKNLSFKIKFFPNETSIFYRQINIPELEERDRKIFVYSLSDVKRHLDGNEPENVKAYYIYGQTKNMQKLNDLESKIVMIVLITAILEALALIIHSFIKKGKIMSDHDNDLKYKIMAVIAAVILIVAMIIIAINEEATAPTVIATAFLEFILFVICVSQKAGDREEAETAEKQIAHKKRTKEKTILNNDNNLRYKTLAVIAAVILIAAMIIISTNEEISANKEATAIILIATIFFEFVILLSYIAGKLEDREEAQAAEKERIKREEEERAREEQARKLKIQQEEERRRRAQREKERLIREAQAAEEARIKQEEEKLKREQREKERLIREAQAAEAARIKKLEKEAELERLRQFKCVICDQCSMGQDICQNCRERQERLAKELPYSKLKYYNDIHAYRQKLMYVILKADTDIEREAASLRLLEISNILQKRYKENIKEKDIAFLKDIKAKLPEEEIIKKHQIKLKLEEPEEPKEHSEPEDHRVHEEDFRSKYEKKYRCKDGDYVRSKMERIIDDFFFDNNIRHEYERKYTHPTTGGVRYTDFYLPDYNLYFEYFGMDTEKYIHEKEEKIKLYQSDSSIHFEYLTYEHDNLIYDHLRDLCQKHSIPCQ